MSSDTTNTTHPSLNRPLRPFLCDSYVILEYLIVNVIMYWMKMIVIEWHLKKIVLHLNKFNNTFSVDSGQIFIKSFAI